MLKNIETEEELLVCTGFSDTSEGHVEIVKYSWLFSDTVELMIKLAKQIQDRLTVRKKMIDEPD
jgi:hypothetical protein